MSGIDWEAYDEAVERTGQDPVDEDEPESVELMLLESVIADSTKLSTLYAKLPAGTPDRVRIAYMWNALDEARPNADEMFDRLVGAGHLDAQTWFCVFTERL